jgi:hypothetical protein
MAVPEKRQNAGTELTHGEALSPASVQSESHDNEVTVVKCDEEDNQHISMVQLHSCYVPHYSTTTCPKHPFWHFSLSLLSKMVM